jgi:hypothetical protein
MSSSKGKAKEKPTLCTVKGDYIIPDDIRSKYDLDDILNVEARSWTSVEKLIESYFSNALTWDKTGKKMYSRLITGLNNFSRSSEEKKAVHIYSGKIASYLKEEHMKSKFLACYTLNEKHATLKREQLLARLEGDTSGVVLSRLGAKRFVEQEIQVIQHLTLAM